MTCFKPSHSFLSVPQQNAGGASVTQSTAKKRRGAVSIETNLSSGSPPTSTLSSESSSAFDNATNAQVQAAEVGALCATRVLILCSQRPRPCPRPPAQDDADAAPSSCDGSSAGSDEEGGQSNTGGNEPEHTDDVSASYASI